MQVADHDFNGTPLPVCNGRSGAGSILKRSIIMSASLLSRNESPAEDPVSETTRIQPRIAPRTLSVEQLDYHLYAPQRSHDPLLEDAYEVWRNVWSSTFAELHETAELHSDEFARQDEIGVLSVAGRCVSVTGLRWLDLSLARAREDSYFKHWPREALEKLGRGLIMVTSNTVVHPDWRGSFIGVHGPHSADPVRLAFVTIAMSIRRFVASAAESATGLSRNDRSMNRVAASLGGVAISRICLHGEDTDVMHFPRALATPNGPVVDHLWARRRQG